MNYIKDYLQIIGDVHGDGQMYAGVAKNSVYSLQVGDFLIPEHKMHQLKLNTEMHKFFGGNHDHYPSYHNHAASLGDYGKFRLGGPLSNVESFFIRGAFSIDKNIRTPGWDWFPEEELSYADCLVALSLYNQFKPQIMFSHDLPKEVSNIIGKPQILKMFGYDPDTFNTTTQSLLSECFGLHQPKYWFAGHYHEDKVVELNGTTFVVLGIGSSLLLDSDFEGILSNNSPVSLKG